MTYAASWRCNMVFELTENCVCVLVLQGQGELQLLHNITGSFRPGVLTALMGVSGAGKTTLMDVLACRKTAGRMEGRVWVSAISRGRARLAR